MTPDRRTTFVIIAIAEVQALLVYAGVEAGRNGFALFTEPGFLTLWYTLILLPGAVTSRLLRSAADRYAWRAGAAFALTTGLLAWHTGTACGPEEAIQCGPVVGPYVCSLLIGSFIALPFVQGFRDHGWRIPYATLFHEAWDNALVAAATAAFTGAAWLILILWAALFDLVGIGFFKELFEFEGFIYPVTGLLVGFGLVLARSQAGALQAVLKVCLALGRFLLPLIGLLALVFLATLVFTGLQPLWNTRTAAALLLVLVFGTVALVNAVLHDGSGVDSARPALRRLLGATLLTLPAYALIAAYALKLRVDQYGWTVDRLWAALLVFVALGYGFAYAGSAVLRLNGRWLGGLPRANVAVALLIVTALALAQSPLLDFRRITVGSQLARLGSPGAEPATFDFEYFRWELGRPGVEALRALKDDPRLASAPAERKKVQALLDAKQRWEPQAQVQLTAAQLHVLPAGHEVPAGLLEFISGESRVRGPNDCAIRSCTLVAADLIGDAGEEWVLLDPAVDGPASAPVYARKGSGWEFTGWARGPRLADEATKAALEQGAVAVVPADRRDLTVGGKRLRLSERQPWD